MPTSNEVQDLWNRIADAVSDVLGDVPPTPINIARVLAALASITAATAARVKSKKETVLKLVDEVYSTTSVAIPVENMLRAMERENGKEPSRTKFRSAFRVLDDAKLEEVLAEWGKEPLS